jgi:NAD-dependent deacetylase
MFPPRVAELLSDPAAPVTVLTGAGISADSGIPTFRGSDGYWTVGSKVYMPEEMATLAMFARHPEDVWSWYLYRLGVCLHAEPNAGHLALAEAERRLGARFTLITQNIDNLHIRAGNTPERTFQIHGNINLARCVRECAPGTQPLHESLKRPRSDPSLPAEDIERLRCADCGAWLRPHVLWFDETYDEENFRWDSSMKAAARTRLLVIAGTSGATTLPAYVVQAAYEAGSTIVEINIDESAFTPTARASNGGGFVRRTTSEALPVLLELCPD